MRSFYHLCTCIGLVLVFLTTAQIPALSKEPSQKHAQSYTSQLLKDFNPLAVDFNAEKTIFFKGAVYASGMDNSYRYSLWKSDGSEAGSMYLADVRVSHFIATESFLFFTTALEAVMHFAPYRR